MVDLMKELLHEVATLLPAARVNLRSSVPVDAPNFPNDLEPVIRASPPVPKSVKQAQED
jgi:hypothetical protein